MIKYYSGEYHNKLTDAIDRAGEEGLIEAPPTLKAFATVMKLNPVRLYAVAKQPKDGEVYDARVFNYDALEVFLERRLEPDLGYGNMYDLVLLAIEADKELSKTDKRKHRTKAERVVLRNGKSLPLRKRDFLVGSVLRIKGAEEVMTVVYTTLSHVCFMIEDGPDLRLLSNWTINSEEWEDVHT